MTPGQQVEQLKLRLSNLRLLMETEKVRRQKIIDFFFDQYLK